MRIFKTQQRSSVKIGSFQEVYDHEAQDTLTALHIMCKTPGVKIQSVREAIKFRPTLIGAKTTTGGDTPLHYAAATGDMQVIKYLLKKGPQVAKVRSSEGGAFGYKVTPLHVAILKEASIDVICAIVRACPETVEMCDGNGNSPLALAKERYGDDNAKVLQVLTASAGRKQRRNADKLEGATAIAALTKSLKLESVKTNFMVSSRTLGLSIDDTSKDVTMDFVDKEIVVTL